MLKRSLLPISPILLGLLAGCATTQTWVPELEEAQQTYAEISQDPIVATLADADLQSAARQLQRAEDAAASFRKPQTVAHQAIIAQLQTLTAQQRARALSANHSVQVALGQDPLLSDEKVAAATVIPEPESPLIPGLDAEPLIAAAMTGSDSDIQAQINALSQHLASLQAQLAQTQPLDPLPTLSEIPPEASASDLPVPSLTDENMLGASEDAVVAPTTAEVAPAEPVQGEIHEELSPDLTMAAAMQPPQSEPDVVSPDPQQLHRTLRAMNAKPHHRGMSLQLGERYFDGKTDLLLSQRATRHLDNVAAVLIENPSLELSVEGHTDNRSTADAGHDLTVNRAISIKSALVLRGIDADRITTLGYGDTRPIAENETALGRLQNRRVELIFPLAQTGS